MVSPVTGVRGALLALLLLASVAGLVPGAAAQCGSLKLLAIGDSLTLGSIPSQARNYPYVFVTKYELQQQLGCFDVDASVAAQGGSGIHVRNGRTLPEAALPMLRGEKWDYVCIMAGINDLLLGGKSADDIWWGGLKAMYDEALDSGAQVVGMLPLPTALLNGWDYREQQRKKIGELIYNYSRQRKNIIVLYYGVDWTYEQKAAYLESDRLHMNEAGHTQLGKEVAKVIRAAMGPDPCSKCARYENDPRAGARPSSRGSGWFPSWGGSISRSFLSGTREGR